MLSGADMTETEPEDALRAPLILADHRERAGGVVACLEGLPGVRVEWAHLVVADFLLGDGVAVERKSARDFVASILDRRLFDQAEQLLDSYDRPLVVLEGDPLSTGLKVHPNAVRGALAHLAVMRRVPVLPSSGPEDTAKLLAVIARQVQRSNGERPRSPAKRRAGTVAQHQEAVAASLPGVGTVLARRLLEHSGSLAALAGADVRTLREVPGIGPQRAHTLTSLLAAPYQPEDVRGPDPADASPRIPAGTT
jgi:Fanconi anemia group M protein